MQAYIRLPREKEFLSIFWGHEKTIKLLGTRFRDLFLQQVTGHRNINHMFSHLHLLQLRMNLTTQHLIILGIIATDREALPAAYLWSVQPVTFMGNMNATRADPTKVTQLLDDCQVTLAINDITREDRIIENLYLEHLQGYKNRLEAVAAKLPLLRQYETLDSS